MLERNFGRERKSETFITWRKYKTFCREGGREGGRERERELRRNLKSVLIYVYIYIYCVCVSLSISVALLSFFSFLSSSRQSSSSIIGRLWFRQKSVAVIVSASLFCVSVKSLTLDYHVDRVRVMIKK